MTFIKDDRLEVNSWREYNFYIQHLSSLLSDNNIDELGYDEVEPIIDIGLTAEMHRRKESEEIEECERKINEKIESLIRKNRRLSGLICKMKKAFQETQLPSDKLAWLDKKNERLCNWVWCFLDQHTMQKNDDKESTNYIVMGDEYYYPGVYNGSFLDLRLSIEPFFEQTSNVSERLASIKKAFENAEADVKGQCKIIKLIKLVWEDVYLNKYSSSFVNWLDSSNQAQCEWAWDYFQGIDSQEQRRFFSTWIPHDDKEKASAMIAAVDMGVLKNLERTEFFLSKMKRAWSQKKFRDKPDGKKAYSINMTPKTKKRLDELADHHDIKLNEVIAKLIKQEHDLIKN